MSQYLPNYYSIQSVKMKKQFQYTDEELISSFQNGNEDAYVELVKRYRDRLISFVYRFLGDFFDQNCYVIFGKKWPNQGYNMRIIVIQLSKIRIFL